MNRRRPQHQETYGGIETDPQQLKLSVKKQFVNAFNGAGD
jgi:hypothetical protein